MRVCLFVIGFWSMLCGVVLGQSELKNHLLVVYNSKNEESQELAKEYAQGRGIAEDWVIGLETSESEEISRAEYESTLRLPLEKLMLERGWLQRETVPSSETKTIRNEVWAIVLMRGIPLKIAQDSSQIEDLFQRKELSANAAAVDSELATLPSSPKTLSGYFENPFFNSPSSHSFDDIDAREIILVTRLDGPSVEDVRRMMKDALVAEKKGLQGWAYLDSRGLKDRTQGYFQGDQWIRNCSTLFMNKGWAVDLDENEAIIGANQPWGETAIYLGWYDSKASGPMFRFPHCFVPGAIGYHLHSFSASSIRTSVDHWVGPLIRAGVTVTMGCVYEPYLHLTPNLDQFIDRLLRGKTFAEAAAGSVVGLSWMNTFVGDPLYAPFGEATQHSPATKLRQLGAELRIGDRKVWEEWIRLIRSMPEDLFVLEWAAWQGKNSNRIDIEIEVSGVYERAMSVAKNPIDRIRVGLNWAQWERSQGRNNKAVDVLQRLKEKEPVLFKRYFGEESK